MTIVTRKVPGGKLLRLKASVEKGKLVKPQLSGDFFLMPSDKLVALEKALDGCSVNDKKIATMLASVIAKETITLVGISAEDIAAAVEEFS